MFRKDLGLSDTKRSIAWFIKGVSVPEQMIFVGNNDCL